jgi:hypothetical protein
MKPHASSFWSYVYRGGGPDACWPWLLGHFDNGYGCVVWGDKTRGTHVVALELSSGEPANGRCALHTCDNPPCCNPKHLWWGTKGDNWNDTKAKDRHSRGERRPAAKLTEDAVMHIRANYVKGSKNASLRVFANKYGVSTKAVSFVVRGETWAYLN